MRYVRAAADRSVGVIFITHNPDHAHPVGDGFMVLNRGRTLADTPTSEIDQDELVRATAGRAELEAVAHELQHGRGAASPGAA